MRSPQRAQYSSPASTLALSIRRRMRWAGPYPRASLDFVFDFSRLAILRSVRRDRSKSGGNTSTEGGAAHFLFKKGDWHQLAAVRHVEDVVAYDVSSSSACSMCERSARLISADRLRSATFAMRSSCSCSVVVICALTITRSTTPEASIRKVYR